MTAAVCLTSKRQGASPIQIPFLPRLRLLLAPSHHSLLCFFRFDRAVSCLMKNTPWKKLNFLNLSYKCTECSKKNLGGGGHYVFTSSITLHQLAHQLKGSPSLSLSFSVLCRQCGGGEGQNCCVTAEKIKLS